MSAFRLREKKSERELKAQIFKGHLEKSSCTEKFYMEQLKVNG